MGMLRDASTSTSSLHTGSEARGQAAEASSANGGGKPGITSKGSSDAASVAEGAAAQARHPRSAAWASFCWACVTASRTSDVLRSVTLGNAKGRRIAPIAMPRGRVITRA
ncbi:hypothetical protein L1887_61004 [Cichorium endivia]|nr:hypothetical protein L1887_61004 [Cichorium endivia]